MSNITKQSLIEQAREQAVKVLRACIRPVGFYASGLPGGYEALWSRDSMTTGFGAATQGAEFKKVFADSLTLLSKNQSELGQIPNCVGSYNDDRKSDVTFNTIDSNLWYLLGHKVYAQAYGDDSLSKKYDNNIKRALLWLRYQDPDELGVLAQQPTMEWFDAFPHKYGYVINTQALYYAVLNLYGLKKEAENVQKIMNGERARYVSLWSKKLGYYLPWGWKNHDGDREHEEWFDTLANVLAIVSGLAKPAQATLILNYIDKQKINRPYPCKTLWPPIKPQDKEWHSYFDKCGAREAYQYSNAGVWPFIGGFYVAALVKTKTFAKAASELEHLAQANLKIIQDPQVPQNTELKGELKKMSAAELKKLRQKEFNEWLDGRSGEPKGEPYQAWSAGAYLYAYECVKQKKVLWF